MTLVFRGGGAATRLYLVDGLNVDGVLRMDILLRKGMIALTFLEATGQGQMHLGTGVPVKTHDGSEISVAALKAGLRAVAFRDVTNPKCD